MDLEEVSDDDKASLHYNRYSQRAVAGYDSKLDSLLFWIIAGN